MRHVKHHCKKRDTECHVAHLPSDLSSTHVLTVHTAPTGNPEYSVVKLHKVFYVHGTVHLSNTDHIKAN